MAKEKKYYVVWKGRKTGVFDTRNECLEQIHQFPGAKFISFNSKESAQQAYLKESGDYIGKKQFEITLSKEQLEKIGNPILESLSVDGARNTSTGDIEYQCVNTKTKELIFKKGPYSNGTNNIAEFLGLVHTLAHCRKNNLTLPIYTDSKTAMIWVKNKTAGTKLERNEGNKELFELIERAEKWLKDNEYSNQILKWETQAWGEIPADFGRK